MIENANQQTQLTILLLYIFVFLEITFAATNPGR